MKRSVRTVLLATLAAAALALSACGPAEGGGGASSYTTDDIAAKIMETVEIPDALKVEEDRLSRFYDCGDVEISEFTLYVRPDGASPDEVAVFRASDPSDLDKIKAMVEKRVSEQAESFRDYLPEGYRMLQDAVIKTGSDVVVLIVSPDAKAAADSIKDMLG